MQSIFIILLLASYSSLIVGTHKENKKRSIVALSIDPLNPLFEPLKEMKQLENQSLIDELEVSLEQGSTYSLDQIIPLLSHLLHNVTMIATNPQNAVVVGANLADLVAKIISTILQTNKIETTPKNATRSAILDHFQLDASHVHELIYRKPKVNNKEEQEEETITAVNFTTQAILQSFANIAGNFANIVADPKNTIVVGNSVTNMINSVIAVALEAAKTNANHTRSGFQDIQTVEYSTALQKQIELIVLEKMKRLNKS